MIVEFRAIFLTFIFLCVFGVVSLIFQGLLNVGWGIRKSCQWHEENGTLGDFKIEIFDFSNFSIFSTFEVFFLKEKSFSTKFLQNIFWRGVYREWH